MDINDDNYLAVVSGRRLLEAFSAEDSGNFQRGLWALLARQTQRFTMGDSTSVPVETARELLKSICFTLDSYLEANNDDPLLLWTMSADKLFKAGQARLEKEIETGKDYLRQVKKDAPPVDNISYRDTLVGLESFFRNYDYRLMAHEIPGDIDYQLCLPVPAKLYGIAYINEYLRRLLIENSFCRCFRAEQISTLLAGYCPDYRELLINIYEPLAANTVGLALLEKDVTSLAIGEADRAGLLKLFTNRGEAETAAMLREAAAAVCRTLHIGDAAAAAYLQSAALLLVPRIRAALEENDLSGVFIPPARPQNTELPAFQFIDGQMMDDAKLRQLIVELGGCRYISDKIALISHKVRSLRDLVEILNVCFWGEECEPLFASLNKGDLAALLDYTLQKKSRVPDWESESGWEKRLLVFMNLRG